MEDIVHFCAILSKIIYLFSPGVNQHLGVYQHLGVAPKRWQTPFICILYLFASFSSFLPKHMRKGLKVLKNMIWKSEQCAKHWSKYTTTKIKEI